MFLEKQFCSREGYKAISKLFGVHHSTERSGKHSRHSSVFPAVHLRPDWEMLRETQELLTLQASVSMLNVKVRETDKYGLFGRVVRRKPLPSVNNMAAQLRFAKIHLNKPQDFWSISFGQTKVEM